MRVLAKDGWTDRSFKSLDELAATIGTTGKDLSLATSNACTECRMHKNCAHHLSP
jgi:hypothetical protein